MSIALLLGEKIMINRISGPGSATPGAGLYLSSGGFHHCVHTTGLSQRHMSPAQVNESITDIGLTLTVLQLLAQQSNWNPRNSAILMFGVVLSAMLKATVTVEFCQKINVSGAAPYSKQHRSSISKITFLMQPCSILVG